MLKSRADPTRPFQKTISMNPTLVILCVENCLAAWYFAPSSIPKRLNINGQQQLDCSTPETLASACADLAERVRDEGLSAGHVHWLIDTSGRALWADSLPQQLEFPGSPIWQLLAWEWIAERLGLNDATPWMMPDWIESQLLPWLVIADDAAERRHMQEALAREHRSESERLVGERAELEIENKRLREQNAALQQVDVERLASFLPALFPRVFTVLGANDLAQLCGRIEPLPIPNPYPEPSEETLRVLQKDFRALPLKLQRQIVGFVSRLPQRQKLHARPEMRELLHELERE